MTIGEILAELESVKGKGLTVSFGFDWLNDHSYRGYYERLAFSPCADASLDDMIHGLENAIGCTYTGWKGGDFTMTENSIVHIANEGECYLDDEIGMSLVKYWKSGL